MLRRSRGFDLIILRWTSSIFYYEDEEKFHILLEWVYSFNSEYLKGNRCKIRHGPAAVRVSPMQESHWIISGKTHGDDEPKSEDLPVLEMLLTYGR